MVSCKAYHTKSPSLSHHIREVRVRRKMKEEEKMVSVVQDIVVSYEARISAVGALIDHTYGIMQESKAALGRVNNHLRETLAVSASLRKKDYDNIMVEIELHQEERHQEIKNLLNEFILVHKDTAAQLRRLLADAQAGKSIDFRKALAHIQAWQNLAQDKVASRLNDNRQEQEEFMTELQNLLNSQGSVKPKEFKAVISKFHAKQKEPDSQKVNAGVGVGKLQNI